MRPGWLSVAVLVGSPSLLGCGGGEAPAELVPATEACLEGVWSRVPLPCTSCEGLETPECDADDCEDARVMVLREDGRIFCFRVRWSERAGTVSVLYGCDGASSDTTWSVSPEGQLVRYTAALDLETSTEARCGGDRLVTAEDNEWRRLDGDLGRVVGNMPDREGCTGVPFSP